MFLRRRRKQAAEGAAPPAEGGDSVIGAGARFQGALDGHVDIRIGGDLIGEARGRTIAVGPDAAVDAILRAWTVDIAGSVRGRVEAFTVNVASTAVVSATIVHHRLNIEQGATVNGPRPWRPAPEMSKRCAGWTRRPA